MSKKRNYRLFLFVLLLADMLAAGGLGILRLKEAIPDTVYIRAGQDAGLEEFLDLPLVTYPESIGASENGSYQIPCSFLGIVPLKQVEVKTVEDKDAIWQRYTCIHQYCSRNCDNESETSSCDSQT